MGGGGWGWGEPASAYVYTPPPNPRPQAPNRRVQRLMEKENKKLRDTAKKERNETVRV